MKMSVILRTVFFASMLAGAIVALPVAGEPEPDWVVLPDMQNHLHYVNLNAVVPMVRVRDSDITFYYFSRNTQSYEINLQNVNEISNTDFNAKRKTMFIIHGWTSNGQSELNDLVTKALLDTDDWNVFNVCWRRLARKNYISSKGALPGLSKIIAEFINHLHTHMGLEMDHLYITGHSLGGQMAGRIGALLNGEPAYIIGLDPALPFFTPKNLEDRLDPSDAKYVQVIHTNGGMLGYMEPLGHADFYPNGGRFQKGCGLDAFGMCSHKRSYLYLAESIRNNKFLSQACDDYNKYVKGICHSNHYSHMGGSNLDTGASGSYFLKTASRKPYGLA